MFFWSTIQNMLFFSLEDETRAEAVLQAEAKHIDLQVRHPHSPVIWLGSDRVANSPQISMKIIYDI